MHHSHCVVITQASLIERVGSSHNLSYHVMFDCLAKLMWFVDHKQLFFFCAPIAGVHTSDLLRYGQNELIYQEARFYMHNLR